MSQYSRTKKYKELREKLQMEPPLETTTPELSRYQKRLNQLSPEQFEKAPDVVVQKTTGQHQKVNPTFDHDLEPMEDKSTFEPVFFDTTEVDHPSTSDFDNDYIDQYIKEVKQYNLQHGISASENTSVNILHTLNQSRQKPQVKPYQEESVEDTFDQIMQQTKSMPSTRRFADTPVENVQMTKEDIMNEVRNLVNTKRNEFQIEPEEQQVSTRPLPKLEETPELLKKSDLEEVHHNTRQQLLNETTQMRAQLDDYENNLNEVSESMRKTNAILNILLVFLIVILVVIIGFLAYWILVLKGKM